MKRYYLRQPTSQLRCVLCRELYPDRQTLAQHYRPGTNKKPCKPL